MTQRIEYMQKMRESGMTNTKIAHSLGISRQRISAILGPMPKRTKVTPPLPSPSAMRAEEKAMVDLPGFLHRWRHKRGLSQDQAGQVVGVGQSIWAHWEQGKVRPSLALLVVRYLTVMDQYNY